METHLTVPQCMLDLLVQYMLSYPTYNSVRPSFFIHSRGVSRWLKTSSNLYHLVASWKI